MPCSSYATRNVRCLPDSGTETHGRTCSDVVIDVDDSDRASSPLAQLLQRCTGGSKGRRLVPSGQVSVASGVIWRSVSCRLCLRRVARAFERDCVLQSAVCPCVYAPVLWTPSTCRKAVCEPALRDLSHPPSLLLLPPPPWRSSSSDRTLMRQRDACALATRLAPHLVLAVHQRLQDAWALAREPLRHGLADSDERGLHRGFAVACALALLLRGSEARRRQRYRQQRQPRQHVARLVDRVVVWYRGLGHAAAHAARQCTACTQQCSRILV